MEETRGIILLIFYTENATLKQIDMKWSLPYGKAPGIDRVLESSQGPYIATLLSKRGPQLFN